MRRIVALILVSLAFAPLAQAFDQPVSGTKLLLKQSSSGKQKLTFQSKDPLLPFPPNGGPDDPRNAGATIEILTPSAPLGGPFTAPPNAVQPGWTYKPGAIPSHRYKRDKAYVATTSIKSILVKSGHGVTVQGEATGITLDGARGVVGIRITIGSQRTCAMFSGAAVTRDKIGTFEGKNSSASVIADCSIASLTGQPPTCGDGEVDQPSEQCDGDCPEYGLDCRLPGAPGECSCCADVSGPSAAPCCNPSSISIFYPPGSKICVPSGCSAPYECRAGDQCQPDESCCTTNNANLCIQAYAPPFSYAMRTLVPCCAGLECSRYALPEGGAKCCASGGTSCSGDADCCTGHCQIDATCEACRTGGTACGNATECCSGSCTGSVCDACAPAGTFCTSDATCCSGSCQNFQCHP